MHLQWYPWLEWRGWHSYMGGKYRVIPQTLGIVWKAWLQIGRLQVVFCWHTGKWHD